MDTAPRDTFIIDGLKGQKKLSGTIHVSGSKNGVLPALASIFLFENPMTITRAPHIEDVARMCEMLADLGVGVLRKKDTIALDPRTLSKTRFDRVISGRLRASIIATGPLLARKGEVAFPHPGGCVIGERPIDLFLHGFKKMGATVTKDKTHYKVRAENKKLKGAEIFFKVQSVTGTETFMMAGVLATGVTVLKNAALEPEILHLASFLNACGAHIEGAGTATITIRGTGTLKRKNAHFVTPPDRIEAGSYAVLGALAAKKLTIADCNPNELESLIDLLERAGATITKGAHSLTVSAPKKLTTISSVKTHEYPGFPTDLQAPMVVLLTQAVGESRVFETIFEGRLNYTDDLIRMGADITLWNNREITVKGPHALKRKELEGPDIRAGLAFIIAAIIAHGQSTIRNVYAIDRGYERIEEKLQCIGARIVRVKEQI